MKTLYKAIFAAACTAFMALGFTGCQQEFNEVKVLTLSRCLQPMNLKAGVADGNVVTFRWTVTNDTEQYNLVIYDDSEMTSVVDDIIIDADQVPYTRTLDIDKSYYYKVKGISSAMDDSKWSVYDKAIKTYAVMTPLYPEISGRTATSVTISWSTEAEDFDQVERIDVTLPGSDEVVATVALSAEDIQAGTGTVSGLTASTEYVVSLYYHTADRGSLDVWTLPDMTGLTAVSTSEALTQALLDGANIYLRAEGSPYNLNAATPDNGVDLTKGVKIYGEMSASGQRPVVYGELNITDSFNGGDLYFESVEFNGKNSKYGFPLQHKEGSTADGVAVGNITYKNCGITGYSKGLIYEWGKTMVIAGLDYDSCDIWEVNKAGTQGGDGIDLRKASTVARLRFTGCTIYNGFRTFIRVDADPVINEFVFENNTVMNICFSDNKDNGGIFAFQALVGSFSLKKNIFLNMEGLSTMTKGTSKYKSATDLGVAASANYFYNVVDEFWTSNFSRSNAAGTILDDSPCFNAKGGVFNLTNNELVDDGIGAPKWWVAYLEEPEDLTLNPIQGNHTWDFNNAKYFTGDTKKTKVRDGLMMVGSEEFPINADGHISFAAAAPKTRKGLPTDGYIKFKVDAPGSVLIKPSDEKGRGNHVVIAVGEEGSNTVAVKGGASPLTDMGNAQKILVSDITAETIVYLYPSGPVTIDQLAWSTDVSPVNTSMASPVPTLSPASVTSGEATEVVVSWNEVPLAGSYSVVFKGKTSVVKEGTSYTIPANTIAMLDAGSYKVEVYANPTEDDIYNTQSAAGVATFAIVPAGSEEGGDEFVVSNVEDLLAAIDAGKDAITLAEGVFDLEGVLTVTKPLSLKAKSAQSVIKGGIKLSGAEVGDFALSGITFNGEGTDNFLELDSVEGVTATSITVENCVIRSFAKSVFYIPNVADIFTVGKVTFRGAEVYNQGSGQGMFDMRNGAIDDFVIMESTVSGGRDWLRVDKTVTIGAILVKNNTIHNVNATNTNGNGTFYVQANPASYKVLNNLVHSPGGVIAKKNSATKVPDMANNFFYNVPEGYFNEQIPQATATGYNGTVLATDPVKNAAENDFTLVNGLAMSNRVGASKWNPSFDAGQTDSFTVTSAEDFTAAVEAGKTEIIFAASGSPYEIETIDLVPGMKLKGEVSGGVLPVVNVGGITARGELGSILIENISFNLTSANAILVDQAGMTAKSIIVRGCEFKNVSHSVFYGNAAATVSSLVFSDNVLSGLGGNQGTFDFRSGVYTAVTLENNTVTGGRDLVRADAETISEALNINNNLIDGAALNTGNGLLYVRATLESYVVKRNLFLNENGTNNLLSKASGVKVPSTMTGNFFYNCTSEKFFTGLITEEIATNGGVILSSDPVKDAAAGDYTLTDALALSSNVGPHRWNPNAGKVTPDFDAETVEELINAIDADKTTIRLTGASYDLTEEGLGLSGILTLTKPVALVGKAVGGVKPLFIGKIILSGEGCTSFSATAIRFSGKDKALSNFIATDAAAATTFGASHVSVKSCEIYGYSHSLYYESTAGSVQSLEFSANIVHDMGASQDLFDLRSGTYPLVAIKGNTFYNGGRTFLRMDAAVNAKSVAIANNTVSSFLNLQTSNNNGVTHVRCAVNDLSVTGNIFANMFINDVETDSKPTLQSNNNSANKPTYMAGNYFYNVNTHFFDVNATKYPELDFKAEATGNGGAVVEEDPFQDAANHNFKTTLPAGDPRWR